MTTDNQEDQTQTIIEQLQSNEVAPKEKETNLKVPSFEGELVINFPLTAEEQAGSSTTGLNTFLPQQLLRGSDKWSYPYPAIALSDDATMIDYVSHFGEDFVSDIFLDGLKKFCQGKWRQATSEEGRSLEDYKKIFTEIFLLVRRDTGPTAAKIGLEITKLMKELGKLKQGTPERKEMVVKIKLMKIEQDKLMEKEMEL